MLPDGYIEQIKRYTTYDNPTGCWLYSESLTSGYGTFAGIKVHRASAHIHLGLDLDDATVQVNHKTNCPNRNCWNPEHLYVGTQQQNALDQQVTGKGPTGLWGRALYQSFKTHCPHGHEYTPENTKIQKGTNKRQCRECDKIRKRGHFGKKKNLHSINQQYSSAIKRTKKEV